MGFLEQGVVPLGEDKMNYVSFGRGKQILIMIPGLGDGLKSLEGMALPLALSYWRYWKDFRVYLFSARQNIPQGYGSMELAEDLAEAMKKLELSSAAVLGVSQGGTVAQYLALNHRELVEKLVLTVSYARVNGTIQGVLAHWMELVREERYGELLKDTAEKSYSQGYLRGKEWLYPLVGYLTAPKSNERFFRLAEACLSHDALMRLGEISCPTLIIGGREDQIVGREASPELAEAIKGSRLLLYEGLGHGCYEEAKDFHRQVMEFLTGMK